MKILNEKQQLIKIKDELYETSQILQTDVNKLENKVHKFNDSFWSSKRQKARFMQFDLNHQKKVIEFLKDYYSYISDRYDEIVNQEKLNQP